MKVNIKLKKMSQTGPTLRTADVIIISSNIKSWAYALEAVDMSIQSDNEIIILDFSKINSFYPRSIRRKKILQNLARQYDKRIQILDIKKMRFLSIAPKAFKFTLTRNTENGIYNYDNIILATIAHIYRSADLKLNIVPVQHLFIYNLRIFLVSKVIYEISNKRTIGTVFLFNGRKLIESSVISAFNSQSEIKPKFRIFERASTEHKYEIFEISPHNNYEWQHKIDRFAKLHVKEIENANLFDLYSKYKSTKSTLNSVPLVGKDWRNEFESKSIELPSKNYITFFSTSTYEITPILNFRDQDFYSSQFDAIDTLLDICKNLDLVLLIRRHPSSIKSGKHDFEARLWEKYKTDNHILFIDAKNLADSYLIAKKSVLNFCWKSSIGVELLAEGAACYTMGITKYDWDNTLILTDTHEIKSKIENALININTIDEKKMNEQLKNYFYFLFNFGDDHKAVESLHRWGVVMKGNKRVYNRLFERALNTLKIYSEE